MNVGTFLLILSLIFTGSSTVFRAISLKSTKTSTISIALAYIASVTVAAGLLLMVYYLARCDFTYEYVASHTNLKLPYIYRISALWAGQEGSMLLWAVIALLIRTFGFKDRKADMAYSIICVCLLVVTVVSNPFSTASTVPADGRGLNKALQDPWMVVHPPLVFIGYCCMGMLFAQGFSKVQKCWLFASMLFLGLGIMSGSIWAYRALGWGGYWAWDPIENTALIPWLIMCALLHKKKIPNALAMAPFILAVLCTYLTRSGILQRASVHSYATSFIGPLLLALLMALMVAVITIIFLSKRKKQTDKNLKRVKVMSFFLISLYLYIAFVLVGTLLPIITGTSVDISFYNWCSIVFIIICSAVLIIYRYSHMDSSYLYISLGAGTALTLGTAFIVNFWQPLWLVLLCLIFIVIVVECLSIKQNKSIWQSISHIGFFTMVAGIITSSVMGTKGILMNPTDYKGINIIHKVLYDMVISDSISYSTKPLIGLFWLGALLLMAGLAGVFIKYCNLGKRTECNTDKIKLS